ncbi:MAG: YggS family pyridoxal phosphate-dependent enzyme [Bdellovibrionales bacterium]|nr:YggS family pyridoxal phosphate-dependent enzyme [Bdellovibrionales bacterium]
MSLAIPLRNIQNKISKAAQASGRRVEDIKILAVSKNVSVELIREAFALGVRDFGENYVQEVLAKKDLLQDLDIHWHFIGHLQSNKVKNIAGEFEAIHSVDRLKIAKEISIRSEQLQNIFIEVNLANEESKSGCSEQDLPQLLCEIQSLENLRIKGLMFMAPLNLSVQQQHVFYQRARKLREAHEKNVSSPHSLLELSMGTSHDFEVAIREGATIVRLGTVLFGERKY